MPEASADGERRVRGVLAISARTKNGTSSASFATNKWKDTMGPLSMAAVRAYWRPLDEVWAGPDKAGPELWKDLRARRLLLIGGDDEVYRDDIVHTAQTMGATGSGYEPDGGSGPVKVIICPGEVHVQCSVDLAVGVEDGVMTKAVMKWMEELP